MKASVLVAANKIELRDVSERSLSPGEALVKVMACGVCPTDVRKFYGKSSCKLPIILGHEIGGEVTKVGDAVGTVKVGDRVTVAPDISCGECYYCIQNKFNYCEKLRSVGYGTDKIEPLDGGYSEYVKVPASSLLVIPDTMSYEEATYVEPLSCAIRTLSRVPFELDDSVGVIGDGRMGLLHLQLLRMLGLKEVYVVGIMEDRLRLAQQLGGYVINANKESVTDIIAKRSRKLNTVIDTTGDTTAVNAAMELLRSGGHIVLFASSLPGSSISLDPNLIHYKELTVTGSYGNGSKMEFVQAIDFIASKKVDVQSLTSHRKPLVELEEGFRLIAERKGLRVIILPQGK